MVDVVLCLNAMNCLANFCYVCLEKKSKLITNINSSLSVNKDIIHIIGHLPFDLAWLKTLRIILICEECCLHLRKTYKFWEKCLKNSALLQGYRDNLNTTTISNTGNDTELLVKLNHTQENRNGMKCEIQSEDEEMYTSQWQPNIEKINDVFVDFEDSLIEEGIICKKELDDKQDNNSTAIIGETEDVFVNLEEYFVKEENTWKREEVDDTEEYPTNYNSTESMDNAAEISVSHNTHVTNTECVSSGFKCKQVHATNKNDLKTAAKKLHKCSTCGKSFIVKSALKMHTRIHTGEKPFECAVCKTRFNRKSNLLIHMRVHTGEKPYSCSMCQKCFAVKSNLVYHMRIHTGEKPYSCSICEKSFIQNSHLVSHMVVHFDEKPYKCSKCGKCFAKKGTVMRHMQIHTGEKPYRCSSCQKCFSAKYNLVYHMRIHTGEKPFECSICKKAFSRPSNLAYHMRTDLHLTY